MTFKNGADSTKVVIDATGVPLGDCSLVIESVDLKNGMPNLTLKTETLTIKVVEAAGFN